MRTLILAKVEHVSIWPLKAGGGRGVLSSPLPIHKLLNMLHKDGASGREIIQTAQAVEFRGRKSVFEIIRCIPPNQLQEDNERGQERRPTVCQGSC